MKIWKYKFTKQEIIKWIFVAYLPVVLYLHFFQNKRISKWDIIADLFIALLFTYPIHLLINFKIRKFIKWFFIGFIPCFILFKFHLNKIENISLLSSILWTIGFCGLMYPMIICFINETKEYRELLKDAPLSFKIVVISSVILLMMRVIRNYLIHRG